MHPLSRNKGLLDSIQRERKILQQLFLAADYVINTSKMSLHELSSELKKIYDKDETGTNLTIDISAFGFKYGLPLDSDLVFDVRCLPNPFYVPELKHKTGLEKEVQDYVMSFPQSQELRDKLFDLISFLIPHYVTEGKSRLVIAFGCTGGKHRSVTFAELTAAYLREKGLRVRTLHRDAEKK